MYTYLTLIEDMKEMVVMLNSLPTCTIVFDSKARLLDMNKLASDFLGIKNREDYINRKLKIKTDYIYIQKLIEELKTGRTICNECLKFKRINKSEVYVGFSASMLYGPKSVFLFQFFEMPASTSTELQFFINSASRSIKTVQTNLDELNMNLLNDVNIDAVVNAHPQQNIAIQLLSTRYSNLTPNNQIICGLLVKGATIKEIAEVQNKTQNYIYGTIKQIMLKLEIKSRKELCRQLKELDVLEL